MIGKVFGRWTVLELDEKVTAKAPYYICECSCGSVSSIRRDHLRSGNSQSCGCLRREVTGKSSITHNATGTKTYLIWAAMLNRCRNKNVKEYPNYGGRGITVCERWYSFENFLADMGEQPAGLQIDRTDNNGNYSQENCRWVNRSENCNNRRNNKLIEHNGVTKTLSQTARDAGMAPQILGKRLFRGWDIEKALTQPVRKSING